MESANGHPTPSFVPLFGAPAEAALDWIDAHSRLVEIWLDCQREVWQPVLDWQADCWLRCLENSGLPGVDALAVRGQEQLA
ncbi:hypothetical protein [Caldimonas tepidiphila]|uniref:hypothetical protein n=1 Tax=Caldimonas tepidiphila TaxID=2315841 RepID=UPI000E5C2DF2|nr:hypothetical protein [Caldimonas tepidiphila]